MPVSPGDVLQRARSTKHPLPFTLVGFAWSRLTAASKYDDLRPDDNPRQVRPEPAGSKYGKDGLVIERTPLVRSVVAYYLYCP